MSKVDRRPRQGSHKEKPRAVNSGQRQISGGASLSTPIVPHRGGNCKRRFVQEPGDLTGKALIDAMHHAQRQYNAAVLVDDLSGAQRWQAQYHALEVERRAELQEQARCFEQRLAAPEGGAR